MNILTLIAKHVSSHKVLVLLLSAVLSAVAVWITLMCPFNGLQVNSATARLIYFADCNVCIWLNAHWIVYSGRFWGSHQGVFELYNNSEYKALVNRYKALLDITLFPGGQGYYWNCGRGGVTARFKGVIRSFRSKRIRRKHRSDLTLFYLVVCKAGYVIVWAAFVICVCWALYNCLGITPQAKLFLIFLIVFGAVLNGVSYYICCVYVWFLKEFSKKKVVGKCQYVQAAPRYTPEYKYLSRVAGADEIIFLMVSLLFSLAMVVLFFLVPQKNPDVYLSLLSFVLVLIVGLLTFVVLFVCSKLFLHDALLVWRNKSVEKVIKEHKLVEDIQPKDDKAFDFIDTINEKIPLDKMDMLSILIAVITLVLDSVALVVAIMSFASQNL